MKRHSSLASGIIELDQSPVSSASSMIAKAMPVRRWIRSRNRSTLRASRTALVATAQISVTP